MSSSDAVSLADVVPSCFSAMGWTDAHAAVSLPPSKTTVVILVDGLGVANLTRARGYARFIASSLNGSRPARTVFPSTTAAALASFVTGACPDKHGILGYQVINPQTGAVVNQLNGLREADVDNGWMLLPSLFDSSVGEGKDVFVVGHPRFADSVLTKMLYGQSRYVGSRSMSERFADAGKLVRESSESGSSRFVFVYISDLDEAAHAHGAASDVWLAKVEELDGQLKQFVATVPSDTSVILTADHGILDVDSSLHLDYPEELLVGVSAVAGEPRCLQLHLDGSRSVGDVQKAWREHFGAEVDVLSREEVYDFAYASQVLGEAATRTGDVYVFSANEGALYPASEPTIAGRNMIGQHGGAHPDETLIPLIVWRMGDTV